MFQFQFAFCWFKIINYLLSTFLLLLWTKLEINQICHLCPGCWLWLRRTCPRSSPRRWRRRNRHRRLRSARAWRLRLCGRVGQLRWRNHAWGQATEVADNGAAVVVNRVLLEWGQGRHRAAPREHERRLQHFFGRGFRRGGHLWLGHLYFFFLLRLLLRNAFGNSFWAVQRAQRTHSWKTHLLFKIN